MMTPISKLKMQQHFEAKYPQEACGLIVDGVFHPCDNIADSPLDTFKISAEDWARCEDIGEIDAVAHSHPDAWSRPSQADKAASEALGVPYIIQSVREGKCEGLPSTYTPCGYVVPLVGRNFQHGSFDCLGIILDYYQRERGIDLGSYDREDDWWNKGKDYYRELLPAAGFYQISTPTEDGDVVLMQIRSPVPNHAGIFLASGKLVTEPEHYPSPGCILHHLYGRDSKRDPFGGYWLDNTVSYWRYGSSRRNS